MALKITSIAADLAKEAEGDWVDVAEWPGVRLRVRSVNNNDFKNARDERQRKLTRSLNRIPYDSEWELPLAKLVASFLLTGWAGLSDDAGNDIPYSPEKAMELLSDRAMRALVQQVILAATRIGEREAEFTGAAAKNSEVLSATT